MQTIKHSTNSGQFEFLQKSKGVYSFEESDSDSAISLNTLHINISSEYTGWRSMLNPKILKCSYSRFLR